MKKTIKIYFEDFWDSFDYETFKIYQIIKKKYNVIIDKNPDYLFFSDHGYNHLKYFDCIKIYYTCENMIPNFNQCDYAIGMHYLTFEDRYMRLPNYLAFDSYLENVNIIMNYKRKNTKISKKLFCNMVVSNGLNQYRVDFFNKLSKYKQVDSGGRLLNNIGGPVDNKLEFQKKYKFSLAFENSISNGYSTEKIVDAFASGGIPIYWGDPLINKIFNPKSFINASDFKNDDELIEYIKKVDSDDKLYLSYINEPIFIDNNYVENSFTEIEKFIYNIFEQTKDNAYRACSSNHWVIQEKKYYLLSDKIVKFIKPLLSFKARIKNKLVK